MNVRLARSDAYALLASLFALLVLHEHSFPLLLVGVGLCISAWLEPESSANGSASKEGEGVVLAKALQFASALAPVLIVACFYMVVRKYQEEDGQGFLHELIGLHLPDLLACSSLFFYALYSFRRKRWIRGAIGCALAFTIATYYESLAIFLRGLGVDSLSEAMNFDPHDAEFYVGTLSNVISPHLRKRYVRAYVGLGFSGWLILESLMRRRRITPEQHRYHRYVVVSMTSLALISAFGSAVLSMARAAEQSRQLLENLANPLPQTSASERCPDLFVYVGESTAVLNMGVYGYFRDTTPGLEHLRATDAGLLLFRHVFSTHTHTSSSLLDALAFNVRRPDRLEAIEERRKVPLPQILRAQKASVVLYSNQGQHGTWNEAATRMFEGIPTIYGFDSSLVGNSDALLERPFDHEHLERAFQWWKEHAADPKRRVLFFHGYAAHGFYLENIPPEFRDPVDDVVQQMSDEAVVGGIDGAKTQLDGYDSAVRYVDHNITLAIDELQRSSRPGVFLFFSDHGESPLTGHGHDSSAFVHEMFRVPFIMYFNATARAAYPALYEKYRELAVQGKETYLSHLPTTIADLLGIGILDDKVFLTPLIGEGDPVYRRALVVRMVEGGYQYVSLEAPDERDAQRDAKVANDDATKVYVANRDLGDKYRICYHRSDTLGTILRGSLVANCLETDVVVEGRELHVTHPPAADVGLTLDRAVSAVRDQRNHSLWLDSKTIDDPQDCEIIADWVARHGENFEQILVEFPSRTDVADPAIDRCAQRIRSYGTRVSYYLPTREGLECVTAMRDSHSEVPACTEIRQRLNLVPEQEAFTDLSFDYRLLPVVRSVAASERLRWNTWNIDAEDLSGADLTNSGFIIPLINDPNDH